MKEILKQISEICLNAAKSVVSNNNKKVVKYASINVDVWNILNDVFLHFDIVFIILGIYQKEAFVATNFTLYEQGFQSLLRSHPVVD